MSTGQVNWTTGGLLTTFIVTGSTAFLVGQLITLISPAKPSPEVTNIAVLSSAICKHDSNS
jgi:hypothetical protein